MVIIFAQNINREAAMSSLQIGDKVKAKHPYHGNFEILGIFKAWAWCGRLEGTTWDWPVIPLGDLVKVEEAYNE